MNRDALLARCATELETGNRLLVLLATIFVGACSGDRANDAPSGFPVTSLPGVYSGAFPCENCPGISTTLWLRSDGRFFMEQRYPEMNGRDAMNAYNLGRWNWMANDRVLVLDGAGPRRVFTRPGLDALELRSGSDLEHRLSRDPSASDFSSRIRMAGTMSIGGGRASFTECLTGYVAPVEKGGDFARFLRQYRKAGVRGEPVFVEFEGRFSWSRDSALKTVAIEQFTAVKADGAC